MHLFIKKGDHMSSLKDKYIQMAENRDDFNHINNSNFMLPDMGEMIQEDLMAEILEQYVNGDFEEGYIPEEKAKLDASFYTETPFSLTPGYYPNEGAFVLKVNNWGKEESTWETCWELNKYDGDTIDFKLDEINDNNEPFTMSSHDTTLTYKNFKEYFKKMGGGSRIQIRFLGIDAAEVPHYEIQPVLKATKNKFIKEMTLKEVKALKNHNTTVLYERCPYYEGKVHERKDDDILKMLLVESENGKTSYAEIITRFDAEGLYVRNGGILDNKYDYYVLIAKEESESNLIQDGYVAQSNLKKIMEEASEVMLVLNANGLTADKNPVTTTKTFNSIYYLDDIAKYLVEQWSIHYQNLPITNFNYIPYGMDNYKRSLGVIYAKHKGSWINVNKYILCNTEHTIANPSFNSSPELQDIGSGISESFNLWSYNRDNIEWLDSFNKITENSYQKKIDLHKQITGIDFTQVRDCALMIGDTLMLLPPESIRNITQLSYERVPNMRSKGTMAKDKDNTEHMLEISLYFYEETGINGIDYTYTTPNGTQMVYKMNGLRSLIAQFKVAPFLPIENGFINDVLGIEAVALQNLSIQNVEGFPRLLKVILTLKEFNYRVYMPDMPIDDNNDTTSISQMTPMFAKCFNWELFRYYYQRSIMAGDGLANIELSGGYASYDYNLQYYSHKNNIGPFIFCGELGNKGEISFYIPDENWLNSALQVKVQRDQTYTLTETSGVELSDNAKAYINELADLAYNIKEIRDGNNKDFIDKVYNLFVKAEKGEYSIKVDKPIAFIGDNAKWEYFSINNPNASTLFEMYNEKGSKIDKETVRKTYIVPLRDAVVKALNNASYFSDLSINETLTKDINGLLQLQWDFAIKLNLQSVTDDDWRDIKEILAKRVDSSIEKIFKDDCVRFSYKMTFMKNGGSYELVIGDVTDGISKKTFNKTFIKVANEDETALNYLINHVEDESDLDGIDNDSINEYNQEIDFYVKDYKNPANMPFVPYVQNVLCKSMLGNISNSFTEVSIKAIEGTGPQYTGGQDTQLQFDLITDDLAIVGALNALPTLASAMAKKYRKVLPAWPIKIHSDLTRLLGVSEVLIDMLEVSTVEGFPGIYSISMRLTSVDRTQRQREALRRLDVKPEGGKIGYDYNADLSMRNYFALDNALAEAELYPDLDLPTIKELAQLGFRFVKYTGQNRSYPDPDFYIVYNYPYTSLLIKKMIKDVLSENLLNPEGKAELQSFKFKDVMSCELTGKVEAYTGLSLTDSNPEGKEYAEIMTSLEEKIMTKLSNNKWLTKEDKENVLNVLELTAAVKNLVMADIVDGWEIKPGWKAPLTTKQTNKTIVE